ncbi:MAG: YfiR family protein [Bacteroidota bacterium]
MRPPLPPTAPARPRLAATLLAALALGVTSPGAAGQGEMEVPVERQVPLLTRTLAFDRSLKGSEPLVLAVVYQDRNRASLLVRDAFVQALEESRPIIQGRPVRVVPVSAASPGEVARDLQRLGAEVAYVTPLRGADVSALARALCDAEVLGLTGVRRYVTDGVALGVGMRDGRPEILLNQDAADSAGADLSARLLQLVTLVSP